MPFFKTHEVSKGFMEFFLDKSLSAKIEGDSLHEHPMIPVKVHTGETIDFMLRYFKRGGESSGEDTMAYFPCIVIQDFQPEINKALIYGKDYVEGVIDTLKGTREMIILPVPMKYRFQVSAITRRYKEAQGVQDWFLQNFDFQRPDCMEFNRIDTEDGMVADIVPYRAVFGEVPRDDGRFEYVFDFTLDTYIHAKAKSYTFVPEKGFEGGNFEELVEKIKFTLKMQRMTDFERILQYEFDFT